MFPPFSSIIMINLYSPSSLPLHLQIVTMGLDVESERDPLTAARAATLTNLGILTTKISRGKPPTDAQLDILITHYEDQQLLGLTPVPSSLRPQDHQGFGGQISKKKSNMKNSSGIALSDAKKRRNWDQDSGMITKDDDYDSDDNIKSSKFKNDDRKKGPNFTEDPWGTKQEMFLRKSLSATLQDLSDREGLTDDELQNKVISLVSPTLLYFILCLLLILFYSSPFSIHNNIFAFEPNFFLLSITYALKLKTLRRSTENIPENLSTHMR